MLIPIKHENRSARRWPVVTFALIAVNVMVFAATYLPLQDEQKQIGQLTLHIILLAAAHPELKVPSNSEDLVSALRDHDFKAWTAS
jgi:hypothetical protein